MAQPPPQPQLPQMPQVPHMPQMPQVPQVSHMQPQMQQIQQRRAYSPAQHSPSPIGTPQPAFALPPNKRPRTENGPQQPTYSPQQPYVLSPQGQAQQPSAASPVYSPSPSVASPQNYNMPYTNGGPPPLTLPTPPSATTPHTAGGAPLAMPDTRQPLTPSPSTPGPPLMPNQQVYTNATMMPIPGTMGPPSKPAERPTREYEYDVSDSLAGTGIDLRAEEQALADYYAGSFGQDARTGLPANTPGGKASMYGAGWANQPAQPVDGLSQEQFEAEAAKKAWEDAAQRLAASRSNEINDAFLEVPSLHLQAEKIAKEHGIGLNLDLKTGTMGKLKHPMDFPQSQVTVQTKTGPDGAVVTTKGSWIPHDAYLADQMVLLSIATKHRVRELLEDSFAIATWRQSLSHGEVPEEWADVAAPLKTAVEPTPEPESAVSPRTNPLKRSFDNMNSDAAKLIGTRSITPLTKTIRESSEGDRRAEDARLKKRQKRQNPEPAAAGSRAGSVAAGASGLIAPETETKAPSKKELKKGALAAKLAEASSTASANQTLSTLMGRKKGKVYSWMTASGSGASTPNRANTPGTPGPASVHAGAKAQEEARLTKDGKYKLGSWREYNISQGKNVQLRDWVAALDMDGLDPRSRQAAYVKLDTDGPR